MDRVQSLHRAAASLAETAARPTFAASFIITDAARGFDAASAIAAAPPGAALIIRDYERPDREGFASELINIAREAGLYSLLAGNPVLADGLGADGVHLPEGLGDHAAHANRLGLLVTISAHSGPAASRAARLGADAVLVSPVFETGSHPGARSLGPFAAGQIAAMTPAPVIALGGVDAETAPRLLGMGFAGIAAISGFHP